MQEILFSKDPLVYLSNISGCNQLLNYLKMASPMMAEVIIASSLQAAPLLFRYHWKMPL